MSNKPFDLEKALAGEPILLLNSNYPPLKAYLSRSKLRDDGIIVEFEDENRTVRRHSEKWIKDFGTNIVMWEEPRPRVQLDLPCPLKAPQEGMWYIIDNEIYKSSFKESNNKFDVVKLEAGRYFATESDALEWLDAGRNARR